jgi:hypothetical protein
MVNQDNKMKKILCLCFSVLFTNFLMAQGGITNVINSPLDVEVGIANTFTFKFTPNPPITIPPTLTTQYFLNYWTITASISGNVINGNINGQTNDTYLYNQSANTSVGASSPSFLTASITFGDQASRFSSITAIATGQFKDKDGVPTGTIGSPVVYAVRVHKIKAPVILPETILDCSNENVQICASDYDDADFFTWSITGGTIVSGQGSSCITVSPNTNGNVTTTCLVKRSTGLSNYTATSTKIITRAARTLSFVTNPVQDYICKGSGLVFQYANQSGLTNVTWNAPNCTVSAESIINGIKQVTIYPNSSATIGSSLTVNAVANFTGGCTASSPSKSFKILDSTIAPTPTGYFNVTLPENESDICTATTFNLNFVATNGFNNGITTFSPVFLWGPGDEIHYKGGKSTTVTVYNKNLCTGLSTSKTFAVYPPAPCASVAKLASIVTPTTTFAIAPNPTNGYIAVSLPERLSGNYQIFDQTNSKLIQESKFDNQIELQINLSQKLKAGIYILKVITDTSIFKEKIILNR